MINCSSNPHTSSSSTIYSGPLPRWYHPCSTIYSASPSLTLSLLPPLFFHHNSPIFSSKLHIKLALHLQTIFIFVLCYSQSPSHISLITIALYFMNVECLICITIWFHYSFVPLLLYTSTYTCTRMSRENLIQSCFGESFSRRIKECVLRNVN